MPAIAATCAAITRITVCWYAMLSKMKYHAVANAPQQYA